MWEEMTTDNKPHVGWGALLLTNAGTWHTHQPQDGQQGENMALSTQLVQDCLLYDFRIGVSVAASSHRIHQEDFGDNALRERAARHWFPKFRSWSIRPWGQPTEEDNSQNCGEFSERFQVSDETVRLHVHRIGKAYNSTRCMTLPFMLGLSPRVPVPHTTRPPLNTRKIILYIWWTCRQVVLLPSGNHHRKPVSTTVATCETGTEAEGTSIG